jgi:uncharacterized Zn finger protein (UPF0148 family)
MPISFSCPACDRPLKVKDELAGRKVKCPKCGEGVVVPAEEEDEKAAVGPPPKKSRPQEHDEEEDRPRKKKKKKKQQDSKMPLILLAGGGLLLVGIVVLVIVLVSSGGKKKADDPVAGPVKQPEPEPEKKQEEKQQPQEIGKKIRNESGGLRTRINRTERLNELRQIALFYQQYGDGRRPPAKVEDFVRSLPRDAQQIAQAIEEKYYLIRPGLRSGIVAYEFDPDNFGMHGVVDISGAARDMPTAELLDLLKQK